MDLGLRGLTFILTGASSGLGRATAAALAADGAHVVVSARDQVKLAAAVAALGDTAIGVAGDLADPDQPQKLVDAALDRFGRLDGALISVGGPPGGPVSAITDEQWTTAFESVFLGGIRMARTASENLTDGGSIAFVLSTSVKSPIAGLAVSNGLRPGLAMVAKTMADELGSRNIRVNALMPGRIATDRILHLDALSGDADAAMSAANRMIPLGRIGEPEEFGRVAAFVLSPAASYVDGAVIPVDGGMLRSL